MSAKYKASHKVYSAWNYQKEIEDLNKASQRGWQLVKGGCFHSRFAHEPAIRYRYQMDYRKVEDMGRYIETFREQGWEYINSTLNGWHYFRKLYDPRLPEEAYEIFTDRQSLQEMSNRWAKFAAILVALAAVIATGCIVAAVKTPTLPRILLALVLSIETLVLLRGMLIMRNPDSSRNRRGDSGLLAVFLIVLILGCASSITLTGLRPYLSSQQRADEISEPIVDNRWVAFDVRYTDSYYLDLVIECDAPLTFEIVDENGEAAYAETATEFHQEDIRVRLTRGKHWFSMSCNAAFNIEASIK